MAARKGMKFVDDGKGNGPVVREGKKAREPFDWRKAGYRVLVAPRSRCVIDIVFYDRDEAADGTTVTRKRIVPLKMQASGGIRDRLGTRYDPVELPKGPDIAPGSIVHESGGNFHDLDESVRGSVEVMPNLLGPMPLYGSQLRIDANVAGEFASKFSKGKEDPDGFFGLIEAIESGRRPFTGYGKRYAFLDDEKAMKRLTPQFADFVKKSAMDADNREFVFQSNNPEGARVGPPLSKFEPERFEPVPEKHGGDGRMLW